MLRAQMTAAVNAPAEETETAGQIAFACWTIALASFDESIANLQH
jgi:hypothetical protein